MIIPSWAYADYAYQGGYGYYDPYATRVLTETSPVQSFTEPLLLAEVKPYLKVPERSPADPDEDRLIQSLISAARAVAEHLRGGDELIQRQWDQYYDYWPSYRIELGRALDSVQLVQYRNSDNVLTTLTENIDYYVDAIKQPGCIAPLYNKFWPTFTGWPSSAVLIRYTSGYSPSSSWWQGGSGESVKHGMRWLISEWFYNRLPYDTPIQEYPYGLRVCLAGDCPPRAR